jgi:hypothetical protein
MSEYLLAVYFWSGVAGLGVVAPFTSMLAGETKKAVCHYLHPDDHGGAPPSLTSHPRPSSPGC